jgi:hypothetical protein
MNVGNPKIEPHCDIIRQQSKYRLCLDEFYRIRMKHKAITPSYLLFLFLTILVSPNALTTNVSLVGGGLQRPFAKWMYHPG